MLHTLDGRFVVGPPGTLLLLAHLLLLLLLLLLPSLFLSTFWDVCVDAYLGKLEHGVVEQSELKAEASGAFAVSVHGGLGLQ